MGMSTDPWWTDHVRNVVDAGIGIVVGVFDDGGTLVYANPGMRHFLGCGQEGATPVRRLVSPSFETLNANRNEGLIFAGSIGAGTQRELLRSIQAFAFRRGSEILIVGEFDVEALERATTQRDRSERLFLDAVASVPIAIALFDEHDRLVLWNRLYADMIARGMRLVAGLTFEEIIRTSVANGRIPDALGNEEAWIRERMDYHRAPSGIMEAVLDGVYVEIREHRTRDGNTILMVHDVTSTKEAEAELAHQRDLLESILEAVPVAVYWKDLDGRYLGCNERFLSDRAISGRDKVIGKTFGDFVSNPDDVALITREDRAIIESGRPAINMQRWQVLSDGRNSVHLSSKVPMRDSNGRITGLIGTFLDITARVEAEEEVARQRNLLEAILDAIPVGVFWKDRAGRYRGCNRHALADRGLSNPEELIGRTVFDVALDQEEAREIAERDERIMADGKDEIGFDDWIRHPDGSIRDHLASKVAVRDAAGTVTGLVCAYQDISERKEAERHLAESEERFRSVIGASSDAVVVIDDRARVVEWNAAAEKIFGYAAAEIVGQPVSKIMPSGFHAGHVPEVEAAIETEVAQIRDSAVEVVGLRKDGIEIPVELTIGRWTSDGRTFFSGIIRDIGERKLAEAALHRSQKLQSLGNMAAGMAHEINNLLLPITSLIGMTIRRLPEDGTDRMRLEKVLEAARRAATIIKQVMEFGRQDAGARRNEDPYDVVDQALRFIRMTLPTSITLKRRLAHGVGAVHVDSDQIRVALANIVANAVDALAGRTGSLCVSLRRIDISAERAARHPGWVEGAFAFIRVTDNGAGMDADVLERAIDPFFTTKEVGEGTGLGLSIVHGIVERHRGILEIESAPGEGTAVGIYLPLVGEGTDERATEMGIGAGNPDLISEMEKKYGTHSRN